jgi:hypothetical protein
VCCVLFERGVLFCVICVFLCAVSYYIVPMPPGKTPFVVQLNNNNNNNNNNNKSGECELGKPCNTRARHTHAVLVRKPEGKRRHGEPRRR